MQKRDVLLLAWILVLLLLAAAYLISWALYWPAFGPVARTAHQAAPLTLNPGDSAHQTFDAAADHLAALRVWLAGARGGEAVRITFYDCAAPEVRYSTTLHLHERGEGRYYTLRVPAVARAEGREFQLDVQAIEGTALARVSHADPLPGRFYLNEYPSPGSLDLNVYHHALPGLWTLRLIAFRRRPAGMLLLGPKVTLSGDAGIVPLSTNPTSPLAVRDWVTWPAEVSRQPDPARARVERLDGEQRAVIAVPAPSAMSYGLRVPQDGELRLGLALPEEASEALVFHVQAQGHTLLERVLDPAQAGSWHDVVLDLRPYGGASPASGALAQVTLSVRPANLPAALIPSFDQEPAGDPLPVAAFWAAPRVTSARSWLLPDPLPEPPEYPLEIGFSEEEDAPRFTPGEFDIGLLGVDVEPLPERGSHGAVRVTLYWRALQRLYTPYTVFVHVLDGQDELLGQWESEPLDGTYPTDVWPPESVGGRRIIRDSYLVPVDGPLPPGAQLAIGLYEVEARTRLAAYGADGARLADDRALLGIDEAP